MKLTKAQETSPHPCISHQCFSFGFFEGFGSSSPFPDTWQKVFFTPGSGLCVLKTKCFLVFKKGKREGLRNRAATWFVSSVPLVNAGWERSQKSVYVGFDGLSVGMSKKPAPSDWTDTFSWVSPESWARSTGGPLESLHSAVMVDLLKHSPTCTQGLRSSVTGWSVTSLPDPQLESLIQTNASLSKSSPVNWIYHRKKTKSESRWDHVENTPPLQHTHTDIEHTWLVALNGELLPDQSTAHTRHFPPLSLKTKVWRYFTRVWGSIQMLPLKGRNILIPKRDT